MNKKLNNQIVFTKKSFFRSFQLRRRYFHASEVPLDSVLDSAEFKSYSIIKYHRQTFIKLPL